MKFKKQAGACGAEAKEGSGPRRQSETTRPVGPAGQGQGGGWPCRLQRNEQKSTMRLIEASSYVQLPDTEGANTERVRARMNS